MYTFLIIIHTIVCIILIISILLQSGKSEGLTGLFGGGGTSQTVFGTRASTFLTHATTTAAIIFLLTCVSLTVFSGSKGKSLLSGKEARVIKETTQGKNPISETQIPFDEQEY